MADKRSFLSDLPVQNKDNFKIYLGDYQYSGHSKQSLAIQQRNSIYPTTPDTPAGDKIVNESKPQVTLKYLRVRGEQYSKLSLALHGESKKSKHNS